MPVGIRWGQRHRIAVWGSSLKRRSPTPDFRAMFVFFNIVLSNFVLKLKLAFRAVSGKYMNRLIAGPRLLF
jgi:hypothetical protein